MPTAGLSPYEIRAKYETMFSLFLLILAFVFRSSPTIVYPQILRVFAAILTFNLIFNRFLRQPDAPASLSLGAIFVNGVLIFWAIQYSGRKDSYLWVMYLLPIFTACLLMWPWSVTATTFYVIAMNAGLYWKSSGQLGSSDWLLLMSRTGLFLMAAAMTAHLVRVEKITQQAYRRQREELQCALEKVRLRSKLLMDDPESPGTREAIHNMNTALTVILGSVQLMLSDNAVNPSATEDLRRVESAARRCAQMLQRVAS